MVPTPLSPALSHPALPQEEEVEKSCEACGGANLAHRLRHTIRRLPRVLALHLKRFRVAWSTEQQTPVCQKLHTAVELPAAVHLDGYLAVGALPPLPGAVGAEPGKENEQQAANPEQHPMDAGAAAAAGAVAEKQKPPARRLSGLLPQAGSSFYSGGGGSSTAAAGALLSPMGRGSTPWLRRGALRCDARWRRSDACKERQVCKHPCIPDADPRHCATSPMPCSARDEADADLQRALALSLQASGPSQQHQAAGGGLQLQRRSAEQGEAAAASPGVALVRARSPGSTAAAEVHLPAEVEAAARASSGHPSGTGGGLQQQWFMGMGRAAGDSDSARKAGPGREEDELQRALELSRLEAARQAAAAAGGGAAEEDEEAQLQRALQLSLLDAGGAAAAVEAPKQGGQQQQEPHGAGYFSLFDDIAADGPELEAAAPAADLPPAGAEAEPACGNAAVAAGGDAAAGPAGGSPAAPPAQAYQHAEIVEDDALPAEAGSGESGSPAAQPPPQGAAVAPAAKSAHYRLHATVAHRGPAASCGHFVADVCDPGSRAWHRFDDSVAERISDAAASGGAAQRECYLLFYTVAP